MAAPAQPSKVLRIGIIQDGKIVQERLIKAGETVTVGEAASNTFVFPQTQLPAKSFELFTAVGESYALAFTEQMKGKISSGGAVVGLDKLRTDPTVARQGEAWRLTLSQQDRGKISIDNITVLFQFVPPPPVQAVKPMEAMDFRPRLLEDDDPVFLGFTAVFTALAAVLVVWVWNAPPPAELTIDEIPDRFTQLVLDPPEPIDTPEVEAEVKAQDPNQRSKAQEEQAASEAKGSKGDGQPQTAVQQAQRRAEAKQEVLSKSLLLKMLVTRGESSSGQVAQDLWSDGDAGLSDFDAVLQEVGGVEVATADNQGQRGGVGTGNEDVDIGDLAGVRGGAADVGGGPEITVQGDVNLGSGQIDEQVGDAESVRRVVEQNFGQLTYCYEQQLRGNPSLQGRVEVEWYVRDRRVTSANVFANTTGNAELGECIVGKIRRWRFDAGIEGEMLYPFIFKPKG